MCDCSKFQPSEALYHMYHVAHSGQANCSKLLSETQKEVACAGKQESKSSRCYPIVILKCIYLDMRYELTRCILSSSAVHVNYSSQIYQGLNAVFYFCIS